MRWQSMLVPAALVALLACEDDATTPPIVTEVLVPPGTRLFINQEAQLHASPRDQRGRVMYGVGCSWGSSHPAVVAVAEDGTVTGISAGSATITATCDDAIGSAQVEVRDLILEKLNPDAGELRASWGSSATDVFAVGGEEWCFDICFSAGIILHYQGASWDTLAVPDGTEMLTGIWGSSANDVFAAGEAGTILHYDGTTWTKMSKGAALKDIWGSSAEDVFAVGGDLWSLDASGDPSPILHYAGTSWDAMPAPSGMVWLEGVWGSSSTDVFAVGSFGTIMHYDGLAWTRMPGLVSRERLLDVWGTSGNNVFAVGEGGTVLHYDGVAWGEISVPTTDDLTGIWGPSANDIYVVGTDDSLVSNGPSVILHYDERGWGVVETEIPEQLMGLWGTTEDVLFVGTGPTVLRLKQ